MTKRRVVVTGIGMISPLGIGNDATWQGLLEGRSGIGRITKFDPTAFACKIAGEVKGFNPEDWIEKKKSRSRTPSFTTRSPRRRWRSTTPASTLRRKMPTASA